MDTLKQAYDAPVTRVLAVNPETGILNVSADRKDYGTAQEQEWA